MDYKDQTDSVYDNWSVLFDHSDVCISKTERVLKGLC